jgi:elongation factor P--beta-lysine ligase
MIDIETIKQERALVVQNITNLESAVNQLTTQLEQAKQNLTASKGAVLGFDRLLEIASAPKAPEAAGQ